MMADQNRPNQPNFSPSNALSGLPPIAEDTSSAVNGQDNSLLDAVREVAFPTGYQFVFLDESIFSWV